MTENNKYYRTKTKEKIDECCWNRIK